MGPKSPGLLGAQGRTQLKHFFNKDRSEPPVDVFRRVPFHTLQGG